jgi:hypothetical protein
MSVQSCEACGNPLDPAALFIHPARRIYDPFECAIHPPVPRCPRCGYPVKPKPAEERPDQRMVGRGGAVTATR